MKWRVHGWILSLLLAGRVVAAPDGWPTDFAAAADRAKSQGEPVLAYFTATWCGPCKLMARTTLTNEGVVATLAKLNRVAIDLDEQPKLAAQYEVRAVPTFLMLAPTGERVSVTTGYQDAGTFLKWLTNGVAAVTVAVARQQEISRVLRDVDQWLAEQGNTNLATAVAELLELCAETNESTRKAAVDRLTALGAREPALLLDGMKHPRLAVRIQVSNLLRRQLGGDFDIDPWSDVTSRANGVALWREKVTTAAVQQK